MRSQLSSNLPSEVLAENGEVLVDGPDGTAITMTPDAAEETADACSTQLRKRGPRRAVPHTCR